MTVPFRNIPANTRLPLFYAELDNSKANTTPLAQRTLLIGQKTGQGTLAANVAVVCQSQSDGRAAAGSGSILAGMIDAYRDNDPIGEMWVLPLADDGTAVAATGSVTFTGTTTAVGTVPLYIGGRSVPVIIASGQTAAQVATTIAAAATAAVGLPVLAAVDGTTASKVNLTARNGGECSNDIDIRIAYKGSAAGEAMPPGLTVAIAAMAGGTNNPSLTTAITNLNDTAFDFIVCSLTDATSLAAIAALLSDTTGRWSWTSQVYGHCWVAKRGTAGANASFATGLNNQHLTVIPFLDSPTPAWKWAAAFAAVSATALRIDPAQPQQSLKVAGLLAPPLASRYSKLVRNNTLLFGGCSAWDVDVTGTIVIENIVTTYVTNGQGQADDSYLEIETLFTSIYVLRALSGMVSTKYARVKLARNGTRLLQGSNVVTPDTIRADLIALYRELEGKGYVQNSAAFAAQLVIEIDSGNPNRVNVLLPATLINQLRVFAVLFQFRLA